MMRIDAATHARARALRFDAARERLQAVLLAQPQAADLPPSHQAAFADWLRHCWETALSRIAPDHPVAVQRYVLLEMTRPRWSADPMLQGYVARMLGIPGRRWSFEAGLAAVWQNVLAARLLQPALVDFITAEARK